MGCITSLHIGSSVLGSQTGLFASLVLKGITGMQI